jgi:hypothetical protein
MQKELPVAIMNFVVLESLNIIIAISTTTYFTVFALFSNLFYVKTALLRKHTLQVSVNCAE